MKRLATIVLLSLACSGCMAVALGAGIGGGMVVGGALAGAAVHSIEQQPAKK